MNRRSASLPKSPLNTRSFLRRALRRGPALLTLPLLALGHSAGAANTEYDVINGQTDLTNATGTTYKTGGTSGTGAGGTGTATVPSVTSDVTFDSGVVYAPTAFTLNSSLTFGSLNDLSATALTIANGSTTGTGDTLTLGGTGDLGDGVTGSAPADLLFVGTTASLTINSGAAGSATALGLVLGQSGNFDLAGTGAATIASVISDGGNAYSITKTGTGSLTLSGANTFSGGVSFQAGTIFAKSAAAFGTGALGLGASTGTAGALVNYNGGANLTVANAINVNAGSTGTLEIEATSGAPTLTGLVTLSNNLLLVNTNSAGGNSLNLTGGITGTGNVTFSATSAAGSVISGTALSFTGTLSNTSTGGAGFGVTANLSGAESFLQNSATSTTTLSGTNTNTGTDTVAVGVLDFGKEVSLFNGAANAPTATASNLIVLPGATAAFQVGGTGTFTAADIAALNALGTATGGFENGSRLGIDTSPGAFTYANAITNSNGGANAIGLSKLGNNTLTLTGTNTYSGPTVVTGGTLQIGAGGTVGTLGTGSVVNNATLTFNRTDNYGGPISQSIGGSGGLNVAGTGGTLTLSGVNTYTGATSVTAGTLDVANSLALQNSSVSFTAAGAITFDSVVTSNNFVLGGVGTTANNSFALQNTAGNAINLQIGNPLVFANSTTSGVFSGTGALTLAGGETIIANNPVQSTITLTGASTYTGTTTVTGVTFNLGGATANGSLSASSPLVLGGFASGGTLNYTRTGTNTQAFASTTINAGGNFVTDALSTQTLSLGAITGNVGGTVDINSTAGSVITTTNGNTNGILGGYATFGGRTTWAVAPSTAGGAITGLAAGSFTETGTVLNAPASYSGQNIDVNASATPTGAITPNSIRFNTATAYTLTLTGVNAIQSGGILVTPTATTTNTITGGTLTGPVGGQLAISNGNSSQNLQINSLIVDNGAATAVTASASTGGGNVGFGNANNSFSGGLYFNGGRLSFTSGGTAFGTGNVTFGSQVYTGAGGGGINFGANTLTSGLLVDADGINSSNGDISSSGGVGTWTLIGTGTASFAGIIGNYSGGRVVNLVLDSGTQIVANSQFGSNAVTVNGGTLQVGNGFVGAFSNANNNVALNVGGGTFVELGNVAGTTAQPFNSGLVVNAGGSSVTVNNNGGVGTLLSFGAAGSRAAGGTANFTLPGGTQSVINGITTVNLNTNGIIGGYATVGGTDWATNATNLAGGNIIALSNSTINAYTASTAGTTAPGATANVDFQASNTTPFAAQTINSLRFNTAAANTLTTSGALTIASGGILETANVGNNATTITGSTLQGSAADLVVIQNNTNPVGGLTAGALTISSQITGAGLTKSGAGELILAPVNGGGFPLNNAFAGGIYLNGGVLNTAQNGIGAASSFTFNGGTLQAAGTITSAKPVALGATGGTVDTNGNPVALSGGLTGVIAGAGTLGGFVSTGAFALTVNDTSVTTGAGPGILTLSGSGAAFNGGIIINNGTVQDGAASATTLGTGYVTFVNNAAAATVPTLDLAGQSPTVAGLIGAGTNGVVTNSGTTGTSTLTLNGVSTQTYGGTINNGTTGGTVALTVALSNPTEAQILTGANTYNGATTVNTGTLLYNGSLVPAAPGAGSTVTVNSGGTLGGTGMLTATTATVATGGTLAPGATRGATTGKLTLSTTNGLTLNGTLAIALGTTGNNGTFVTSTSGLTVAGATLTLTGTPTVGTVYDLVNYTGTLNATGANEGFTTINGAANFVYTVVNGSTFSGSDLELDVATPVPEPSTWTTVALLLAMGAWQYRRRNRTCAS